MSKNIALLIALAMTAALASTAATAAPSGQNGSPALQSAANKKPNVSVTHYEDWKVVCPKSNQPQARCKMTQLVENPKNGQPIMRVVMAYPPQINGAAMIFVTPLGTRLAPGLKLSAGGHTYHIPFQICLSQGCRADYPIKSTLLGAMKNGVAANVELVGPRGRTINLEISLMGFTEANRAIQP